MKNSLTPTGTSDAILRLTRLVFPLILASSTATGCGPQAAPGPQLTPGPQAGPGPQAPQGTPGPQPTPGPQASPWPQAGPGPQAAPASQSGLVGQWRTVLQGANVTITIEGNGQYMQVGVPQNGGTQTAQGGPYQLVAPNTIIFTVTDWSPKIKVMFIPDPGPVPSVPNPVGPYPGPNGAHYQTYGIPQPPGSRYAYVFNGPNTLTLNNEQAQETITFTRVTTQ